MDFKADIKEENNNCKLLNFGNRDFILLPIKYDEQSNLKNYINLNIEKWSDNQTIIEISDVEYSKDIFYTISNRLEEGMTLIKILDDISELYLKYKTKYMKFRGDLTEAMFLAFVGGKWINDGETFDIEYNDEYYEVKSFSRQKKTIIISIEQLQQNTRKVAYPIIPDQEGYSIMELSKIISGDNPEFSRYLSAKYGNDDQINSRKYAKVDYFDITDQLNKEIKFSDKIVSGKLEISIET